MGASFHEPLRTENVAIHLIRWDSQRATEQPNEGIPNNSKVHRGHSKEKRSDCPLVTLGLVVDGSGFVRSSQTFAGNFAEAETLATMLTGLNAPPGALVVMDAGIASEANIDWLKSHGYRYLVVSCERTRQATTCPVVGAKCFFIILSGLLQRIQLTLDLGYLLLVLLDGFPVFSNFISPLNRFCFPVVTTANEF